MEWPISWNDVKEALDSTAEIELTDYGIDILALAKVGGGVFATDGEVPEFWDIVDTHKNITFTHTQRDPQLPGLASIMQCDANYRLEWENEDTGVSATMEISGMFFCTYGSQSMRIDLQIVRDGNSSTTNKAKVTVVVTPVTVKE